MVKLMWTMKARGEYRKRIASRAAGARNMAVLNRSARCRRRNSGASARTEDVSEPESVAIAQVPHEGERPPPQSQRTPKRRSRVSRLQAEFLLVVGLENLRAVRVGLPVNGLERALDLVECREVREVVLLEPVRHLALVVRAEESLAQLAPLAVVDRPAVRELDLR